MKLVVCVPFFSFFSPFVFQFFVFESGMNRPGHTYVGISRIRNKNAFDSVEFDLDFKISSFLFAYL